MFKFIGILTILLWSATASAATLHFTLGSKHFHVGNNNYVEFNPGVFYEFDNKVFVGGYGNSYGDFSPAIGRRYEFKRSIGADVGLSFYPKTISMGQTKKDRIVPLVQVTYDIGLFRIGFSPVFNKEDRGLFTLRYVVPLQ